MGSTVQPKLADAQVTIVGLGLMGGSLAAALRASGACRRVVGVARRPITLQTARSLRFIHEGTTELREGVADADIVVLATPVRDILGKIALIGPWLKAGAVLMDVGSTKGAICQAMEALPDGVQPIGGHPMCGKESTGITMAEPGLYQDRVFVLTPLKRTSPMATSLVQSMVDAIGGRWLILEPERHDRLVAAISHLPYMMAVTLVKAAAETARDDGLAWRLAAGGFRDTSRVASGSIPMMMDILTTNRGPVLQTLYAARAELAKLIELMESEDTDELRASLEEARMRRQEVYR